VANLAAIIDPRTRNAGSKALLTSHRMPVPATFSFDYFGMPFDVGIRRLDEGGAELVVRGRLGTLPYSAESTAARKLLLSVVEAARFLPLVEVDIDQRQNIVIRGLMTFKAIPAPATVAAGAAAVAVAVKPLCELMQKAHELARRRKSFGHRAETK